MTKTVRSDFLNTENKVTVLSFVLTVKGIKFDKDPNSDLGAGEAPPTANVQAAGLDDAPIQNDWQVC